MPQSLGSTRPSFYQRGLQISLVAGAIFDFFFAGVMVLAPDLPEKLLGLRQPGDAYFLWLIALFLVMLGSFYLLAAYDLRSYRGNVYIAIVGRTLGFGVMAFAAWSDPSLRGLYPLAFADLAFAVAHAGFFWPIRR
ncbi:MAG: hypothetical protein MI919_22495 [Holophagales bacterium]|nr:hypothetical protein [Holophagales bacterium]